MTDALNKLRSIVNGTNSPKQDRGDPRDAVGSAEVTRSDEWLAQNQNLPENAKYSRWKTEVRAGFRVTPNNKDYVWKTEAKLHPMGEKFAVQDYLDRVHEKLSGLDDSGKESYLRDIAREAPSSVLNPLLLDLSVLNRKSSSKTKERARLANIHEFDNVTSGFSKGIYDGKLNNLNPEVSVSSHAEDMVKAWSADRTDISVDQEGRIAITLENGEMAPVWSLEHSALTWEEEAVNAHDLSPISKRKLKKVVDYSRQNARSVDRVATLELFGRVQTQPREFQASIIVDGAALSKKPMAAIEESIQRTIETNMLHGDYLSFKDISRDYISRWNDVKQTVQSRNIDGFVSHTQRSS